MYVEGSYSAARRSWDLSLKYDGVESMDRRMTYWTSIFGTSCSIYREPRTWRPPTLPLALCAVNAARDEVDDDNLVSVVDGEMMMVFCYLCAAVALPGLGVRDGRECEDVDCVFDLVVVGRDGFAWRRPW